MMTVETVRRFGGAATDAILDPATVIFTLPEIEGLIGYRREAGVAVVFGDPVCRPEDRSKLVGAFHAAMQQEERKVIYVAVSQSYMNWALGGPCRGAIEFGEELVFDPSDDPKKRTGNHASLVRRKVRHAAGEGVAVEEYYGNNPALEKQMQQVGEEWVKGRKGPQIHISSTDLFSCRQGRRWFYAKQHEKIVGVILLSSIKAKNGWLMNHLMITPQAPHGTPELLVTSALEAVANEGCHFVTVGAVPYPQLGKIYGFASWITLIAKMGFKFFKLLFRLGGRKKFWEKFHPQSYPLYLLFTDNRFTLKEVQSLLKSMHGLE